MEATTFTYDIQQAGYRFDQYDLKGTASYPLFIDAFKYYPWKAQAGNSNGGSEATISVRNKSINTDLFVSVVGDANEFAYLIGIVEPKKVKSFFGLGKEKEVRWVSIYLTEQPDDVKKLFKLFFNNQTDELRKNLEKLSLFLEQKAAN